MQKNSNDAKSKLNQSEVSQILRQAFEREEPVMFSPSGLSASFFCIIKDMSETEVIIKNPIPPEFASQVMLSHEFFLFCRSYRLETDELKPRGKDLVFKIPTEAELSRERSAERVYYSDKDDCHVLILHPYDRSTVIKRRVFDVSQGGLSFRARQMSSFIQPGRLLPTMHLYIGGKKSITKQGKIVYVTRIIDTNGESFHQVGVKFTDKPITEAAKR